MKKIIIVSLVIALMLSFSACSGGIKLDKDQSMIEINDKEVVFTIVFSENEFADNFDIDTDQRMARIEDDFKAFLEKDGSGDYMDLKSIKIKKNLVTLVIIVDDIDEMDIDMGDFEDLIDYYDYKDAEEFAENYPFVVFRNEKAIDADDMDKYDNHKYIEIEPLTQQGTYFKISGKITAVDLELTYEYISKDTIFADGDSSYGWILYK